ncbi:MAG: D-alanine--D-alanine ligase, partial [candidate division KSB1 bacterium]|nr:D-alanine--D-alanine ligase [candidate division KSB1 bacterium]
ALFRQQGVVTPDWLVLRRAAGVEAERAARQALGAFALPFVVKPDNQGSTVGFSLVEHADQVPAALRLAWTYGDALVEPFIAGREVTVAILGEEALPVVEIVPEHGVYDYVCKYTKGKSQYIVPAQLPEETARRLQVEALRAYKALGCRHYARADFRLRDDQVPFCLEINTAPGMTELSLVPKAARAAGISFEDLCDRLVTLAVEGDRV